VIDKLLRWRWAIALLFSAAIASLFTGVKHAAVPDNSLTVWFLETDPQLKNYYGFQEHFGNDEVVLLHLKDKNSIFTHSNLTRLDQLSKRITQIKGIERVTSILNVVDAFDTPQGLRYQPLVQRPFPSDAIELKKLQIRASQNDVFKNRLVSTDGKQAMFWIQMDVMADIDTRRDQIISQIYQVTEEILENKEYSLGGIGVIYSGLNIITQQDFGLFISLGYLIMFIMLWWIFRSLRLVLASVGVIFLGTFASLGIYGLFKHQINMVTVVIPTLIIVLGIADAVHFPSAFIQIANQHRDKSRFFQVRHTLLQVFTPCLLTTLTTMAGFLALASSPMAVIRHLGIYSAIGLGVALIASTIFMTLAFFSLPRSVAIPRHPIINKVLSTCRNLLKNHRAVCALISFSIIGLSTWGAILVRADTYSIGYLPDEHKVVKDHLQIENEWGHYSVLDFMVRPSADYTIGHPKIVNGMEHFIQEASKHDDIRNGFSLADIYRRLATIMGSKKPPNEKWRADELAQLDLLLESQGFCWQKDKQCFQDNILFPFVTQDKDLGRFFLVGGMLTAMELDKTLHELEQLAETSFQDTASIEPAGYPPLYVRIIDYVTSSQIRSFFIAVGIIFILMLIWLRSLRLALISLVPNFFPVLTMMGVMGALKINLDVATATVAAIVIGVAIDDTVHFLHHWKNGEEKGLGWSSLVDYCFEKAGSPAVTTTILLLAGYPVLILAGVKTVVYFGILTTTAAVTALFADLIILPLILQLWQKSNRVTAQKID
jgi:predicted RND superfamily exporter protein